MTDRLSRALTSATVVLLLGGCDPGPSGPGSYDGSVRGPGGAPGSALLLLTGEALVRVEGTGGTLGWSAPVTGDPREMRVLLVDPDPSGAMTFRVFVEDLSIPTPNFTILQLADRQNEPLDSDEIMIRIER